MNYYNEIDPQAAAWLRMLIREGVIPFGVVDTRSIEEVQPSDLSGYTQCHFFAGIGVWAFALGLAGWPEDECVWTGSCPCQPFSQAGEQKGFDDKRHLWPHFFRLISACKPATVLGEQVASALGRVWLAGIRSDLETLAYEVGASDLCAAGVGSPQIRQRLYWVAHSVSKRPVRFDSLLRQETQRWFREEAILEITRRCAVNGLADTFDRAGFASKPWTGERAVSEANGESAIRMANTALPSGTRLGQFSLQLHRPTSWSTFDAYLGTDGDARRVEPGSFPLAHGSPARVGRLRGYGNAIVAELAAEFIQAAEEARVGADLI